MPFSYPMLVRYFLVFALLMLITSGAPTIKNARKKKPQQPKANATLPSVTSKNQTKMEEELLPESFERQTNYETLGECRLIVDHRSSLFNRRWL